MTYMRSLRLTLHTWLGLNPQIGRPLSRIVVPLVYFIFLSNVEEIYLFQTAVYSITSKSDKTWWKLAKAFQSFIPYVKRH
jgi:hypothetical protein